MSAVTVASARAATPTQHVAAPPFALAPDPGTTLDLARSAIAVSVDPGHSATGAVVLTNTTSHRTLRVRISSADATSDASGAMHTGASVAPRAAGLWVAAADAIVVVAPSSSVRIPFTVQVPADAPQGRNGAALIADVASTTGSESGTATLFLSVDVGGTGRPIIDVVAVGTTERGGTHAVLVALRNSGAVRAHVHGTMRIAALGVVRTFDADVAARSRHTATLRWTPPDGRDYRADLVADYDGTSRAEWHGTLTRASSAAVGIGAGSNATTTAGASSGGSNANLLRALALACFAALLWLAFEARSLLRARTKRSRRAPRRRRRPRAQPAPPRRVPTTAAAGTQPRIGVARTSVADSPTVDARLVALTAAVEQLAGRVGGLTNQPDPDAYTWPTEEQLAAFVERRAARARGSH